MWTTFQISIRWTTTTLMCNLTAFKRDLPSPGVLQVSEGGLVAMATLDTLDTATITIITMSIATSMRMDTTIAIRFN